MIGIASGYDCVCSAFRITIPTRYNQGSDGLPPVRRQGPNHRHRRGRGYARREQVVHARASIGLLLVVVSRESLVSSWHARARGEAGGPGASLLPRVPAASLSPIASLRVRARVAELQGSRFARSRIGPAHACTHMDRGTRRPLTFSRFQNLVVSSVQRSSDGDVTRHPSTTVQSHTTQNLVGSLSHDFCRTAAPDPTDRRHRPVYRLKGSDE